MIGLSKRLDKVDLKDHPCPEIGHGDVAKAMIGLICVGEPAFDAIEPFRDDHLFLQYWDLTWYRPVRR